MIRRRARGTHPQSVGLKLSPEAISVLDVVGNRSAYVDALLVDVNLATWVALDFLEINGWDRVTALRAARFLIPMAGKLSAHSTPSDGVELTRHLGVPARFTTGEPFRTALLHLAAEAKRGNALCVLPPGDTLDTH